MHSGALQCCPTSSSLCVVVSVFHLQSSTCCSSLPTLGCFLSLVHAGIELINQSLLRSLIWVRTGNRASNRQPESSRDKETETQREEEGTLMYRNMSGLMVLVLRRFWPVNLVLHLLLWFYWSSDTWCFYWKSSLLSLVEFLFDSFTVKISWSRNDSWINNQTFRQFINNNNTLIFYLLRLHFNSLFSSSSHNKMGQLTNELLSELLRRNIRTIGWFCWTLRTFSWL